MKIGSLFAGIGGFDLAARAVGWETVWYSEIDPYASAVMARHFPEAINLGDVTTIDGKQAPRVDLLCGGFPCQDISVAGKGIGIEGQRSGLWRHYARLIAEIAPKWIVIENVSALRSRGLDQVLGQLAALGYDAEWHCVPATYVGAPHRRDRVWIVAWRADSDVGRFTQLPSCDSGEAGMEVESRRDALRLRSDVADASGIVDEPERAPGILAGTTREVEREGLQRQRRGDAVDDRGAALADADRAGCGERRRASAVPAQVVAAERGSEGVADADRARHAQLCEGEARRELGSDRGWGHAFSRGGIAPSATAEWWAVEPDVGRVAHGVPARVDRLRCLGNAVVPQIPYLIFHAIQEIEQAARGHDV